MATRFAALVALALGCLSPGFSVDGVAEPEERPEARQPLEPALRCDGVAPWFALLAHVYLLIQPSYLLTTWSGLPNMRH